MVNVASIIEEGKFGGPQAQMARVAKALQGHMHTMVIMPEENSEAFRTHCRALDVPYETIWMSRITRELDVALRYVLCSIFEVAGLILLLRKGRYDLVHASGGGWQYKGVIAGRLAGKKVIWNLNDTHMPWLLRKIFEFLSPLADGYVYSAERARKYYSPLVKNGKPSFVIPPPVDTVHFTPYEQYAGDEALIDQWMGRTVIGTIANINPIKGLEVFIRSAAVLNKRFDNLVFAVVGPVFKNQHRYFKRLQVLCRRLEVDNLKFIGGRSDVRPMLKRFDVFVCSSYSETGPMTLWEAMAMEKAVVSTDVGDVSQYIRNGYNGFIVAIGNHEEMAERIAALIDDKTLRKALGNRGRTMTIQELDIKLCAQKHWKAYLKILGKDQRFEAAPNRCNPASLPEEKVTG